VDVLSNLLAQLPRSGMVCASRMVGQPVSPPPLPEAVRHHRFATAMTGATPAEACRLFSAGPPASAALCYPVPSRVRCRAAAGSCGLRRNSLFIPRSLGRQVFITELSPHHARRSCWPAWTTAVRRPSIQVVLCRMTRGSHRLSGPALAGPTQRLPGFCLRTRSARLAPHSVFLQDLRLRSAFEPSFPGRALRLAGAEDLRNLMDRAGKSVLSAFVLHPLAPVKAIR